MDHITLFGKEIPLYGILFYAGMLLAALAALWVARRRGLPMAEVVYSAVYTFIGALLGAKFLFIAVNLRTIIEAGIPFVAVIKGGFVFYGGFLGGLAGLFLYTRQFKLPIGSYLDIFAVVLPLGHAVGRIGCFFAGCCYGIPWEGGHVYTDVVGDTPLGIPLLPIQLIESGLLMLLFLTQLFLLYRYPRSSGLHTHFYLLSYPVVRFLLEFFRGDAGRGVLLLSTSQWISLAIIAFELVALMRPAHRAVSKERRDTV